MTPTFCYADVIDATRRTLWKRRCYFCTLSLSVALVSIAVPISAWISNEWEVTSTLLLLPAGVAVFVAIDVLIILRWRAAVLDAWCGGRLRLDALLVALKQVPDLKGQSLEGMIGKADTWPSDTVPDFERPKLRQAQQQAARATAIRSIACALAWVLCALAAIAVIAAD